ncbi:hypothetical protein SSP531S_53990 [Streptomyces spongiicola]|uniref:Uncharacterized protein n=1 Tax=Streptomyces spongiicola TaxID=1690221 RepID=A0A388T787_9ACTN|nr:hypothetical protein [Streptomyces spongiicola]GBQ03920.1 hypothetical protein SSP531S_53990 [Streptomyces spongiicola]
MPALPLPLTAICGLACEPSLLPRVRVAIAIVAQEVFVESPATPGYPMRFNLAKTMLSPTEPHATQMMVGIVASPPMLAAAAATGVTDPSGMAAAISDDQLLTAIRQGWNAVAGVSPTESAQPAVAET